MKLYQLCSSKNVRNDIQEAKADIYKPVFHDVFPFTYIKR